jgi:hypothetical protein
LNFARHFERKIRTCHLLSSRVRDYWLDFCAASANAIMPRFSSTAARV